MNVLDQLSSMPAAQALGWALLHFLWQGALVGAVTAAILRGLRGGRAETRYVICCAALATMCLAPIATMAFMWPASRAVVDLSPAFGLTAIETPWQRVEPALPALTLLWLLGVLVLQTRLVFNWSHAQHLKRDGTTAAPRELLETVRELSTQLSVRGHVAAVESTLATVPMLIGWLRPVIVLPTVAIAGLTPGQLRSIIAHELGHVRRHDYLVNIVQSVVETLLFYHPAVWWLSERLRLEREYCCDDVAVQACGDKLCYARALASLDALRDDVGPPLLASTGGSLMNRISRLAGAKTVPGRGPGGWLAPTLIALSLTAAVSAMALRTGPETPGPDEVRPIDRVDLVGILKKLDHEEAETFAVLHEAGLDNRALMTLLMELGASNKVFTTIELEAHHAEALEQHLKPVRDRIADALAAGRITVDEAETHLQAAQIEAQTALKKKFARRHHNVWLEMEDHLAAATMEIETLRASGEITAVEADEKLEALHARAKARLARAASNENIAFGDVEGRVIVELQPGHEVAQVAPARYELVRLHGEKLQAIQLELEQAAEALDQDVAAGRITAEEAEARNLEARAKLDAIRAEIAAQDDSRFGHLVVETHPRVRHAEGEFTFEPTDLDLDVELAGKIQNVEAMVETAHRELTGRLERGEITDAEAHARFTELNAHFRQLQERVALVEHKRLRESEKTAALHRYKELAAETKAAVADGRLTRAEAEDRLKAVHDELGLGGMMKKRTSKPARLTENDLKHLRSRIDAALARVEDDRARGVITDAAAQEKIMHLLEVNETLDGRSSKKK